MGSSQENLLENKGVAVEHKCCAKSACCGNNSQSSESPITEASIFDIEYEFNNIINSAFTWLSSVSTYLEALVRFLSRNGGILFTVVLSSCWFYLAHWRVCPEVCSEFEVDFWYYVSLVFIYQMFTSLFMARHRHLFNELAYWKKNPVIADMRRSLQDEADREKALRPENEQKAEIRDRSGFLITGYGKFCHICNEDAPIRSHHCPLCHVCVMRKDHHCFVTGTCIGLGNQRYFVSWLIWMSLSLVCSLPYFMRYCNAVIAPWFPFGWLAYFAPFAFTRFLAGYESFSNLFFLCILMAAVGGLVGMNAFLAMQLYYMTKGYTTFEFNSGRFRNNYPGDGATLSDRIRLVMGRNWLLTVLFPLFYNAEPVITKDIAENLFRNRIPLVVAGSEAEVPQLQAADEVVE